MVWPEARQLIDWLLSAIAAHRPQTWASVLDHPFLSEPSAFELQVLDSLMHGFRRCAWTICYHHHLRVDLVRRGLIAG